MFSVKEAAAPIAVGLIGQVKWWDRNKGIGFILSPDGGGRDVFVHYSNIISDTPGPRNLLEGQQVRYDLVENGKGPAAVNVRLLRD